MSKDSLKNLIESLSESEKYQLFVFLSEQKSSEHHKGISEIPMSFFETLLKDNLKKLVSDDDIDKYFIKPKT